MAASSWFSGGRRDVISNENAARLIDTLPAPAGALHSGDGTILYVNDALEEAFGAPRSQLLGQGIQHFHTDPGDGAALAEQLQGMGYVHDADVTWRRPNGTLMDVRLSARVTEIGGEPIAVFLVKDITAERAAEAEARRLREAIDNMGEGFVLYDSEQRLVFSNKKYRALYPELANLTMPGARREDIRRMFAESDAAAQMPDAYTDLVPELDANSGHKTGRATREVEFRRLDGTNIKISDFQLSDGSIIGVRTDITDIRARDRHLRAIYENAFVGIALVDDQGRVAEANPTLYSMLGLAVDTPDVRCSDCISVSDYADFMVDMTELIAGNVPHIAMVLEFARPDSTSFTARLRATRIFDDAGIIWRLPARSRSTIELFAPTEPCALSTCAQSR
ncbi:MAG: PAS domain S-box protein [Alphaproteobacteria bacterium]|nr:PAS domain S-box protein [Alphaproteobacteria bacterium]